MNYQELEQLLFSLKEEKYGEFSKSLSNSDYLYIGVRSPIMKDIVKKHYQDEDLLLEDFKLGTYFEIDNLYFCFGLKRCRSIEEQYEFLLKNIKYAKSWSVTDTIPQYLKKMEFEGFFAVFLRLLDTSHLYSRRLAYVIMMKFYRDNNVLKSLRYIKENEEYMVMMGEAWLLATMAINFPQEIYEFLSHNKDETLKRKTISKIVESYRINEEYKNKFKSLRK